MTKRALGYKFAECAHVAAECARRVRRERASAASRVHGRQIWRHAHGWQPCPELDGGHARAWARNSTPMVTFGWYAQFTLEIGGDEMRNYF